MYKEGRFDSLTSESYQKLGVSDIEKSEILDDIGKINNLINSQAFVRNVSLNNDGVIIKINLSGYEETEEVIEIRWAELTFQSKIHLLHSSIRFCSVQNEPGGFVEDDTFVGSTELIDYCAENENNFFLRNYAQSFLGESHRKEAGAERKRALISKLWSSSVSYTAEHGENDPEKPAGGEILTMFYTTEFTSVILPRHVSGSEDLTDEECNEIYDRLVSDKELIYDVYFSKHLLEAEEWTDAHRDKNFEHAFLPHSALNDFFDGDDYWQANDEGVFRFSICKLSSDSHGLYREYTGEVVDLFHKLAVPKPVPELGACEVFRDIDGLISSIGADKSGGVNGVGLYVDGQQYSDIFKTYPRLFELLPSNLVEMFRLYCEEYEIYKEKINNTKQKSSFGDPYNSTSGGKNLPSSAAGESLSALEEEYDLLISSIKNWGKELLSTKTISETPFLDLMPSTVDEKQVLESESTYKIFTSMRMRESMERYFGFSYEDLTTRNQLQLINFLIKNNTDRVDRVRDFIKLHGTNGLRTFLALERSDETLGDYIVSFGQYGDVAGTVFKYYGELLDSAERAEVLVKEVTNCEGDTCVELADQVRENILNRAQKDLEKAVLSNNPDEIAEQVETYVANAKEYVALLQEVGTGKIEKISSGEVTVAEQERMRNLLQANYRKAYPESENDDFKRAVAGSLNKSFTNPDTTFRVLRDGERIVSYNRFDVLHDYTGREVSYFGSFNADPTYSGVGGIMLEQTIKDELESGRPMMAHCDPVQPITKKYIEDGFMATAYYSLAGKLSFEIWRSKDSSALLESKDKNFEDLVSMANESQNIILRVKDEQETYPELQYGNLLTRYFTHKGKTFLVFEKIPEKLQRDFTPPKEEHEKAV